jgi:hypothetical protein
VARVVHRGRKAAPALARRATRATARPFKDRQWRSARRNAFRQVRQVGRRAKRLPVYLVRAVRWPVSRTLRAVRYARYHAAVRFRGSLTHSADRNDVQQP